VLQAIAYCGQEIAGTLVSTCTIIHYGPTVIFLKRSSLALTQFAHGLYVIHVVFRLVSGRICRIVLENMTK
jgi:hypothetical protein